MTVMTSVRALPARCTVQVGRVTARLHDRDPQAGMTTAEYAVGTVAACGFGGVLYKVVSSPQVLELLRGTIGKALKVTF